MDVQWEVPTTLFIANVDPQPEDMAVAHEVVEQDSEVETFLLDFHLNVGYAKACNSVASFVPEPRTTVAFFNADTELRPGVLDSCHWLLTQNADYGIVGPKQVNRDGLITHGGIFGLRERPSFDGRWKVKDQGQFNDVRDDVVSVSGSAYFVKRACWDALAECPMFLAAAPEATGAFLPTPHYYEETFCSYHAIEHGWRVVYNGEATMIHEWHQASPVGSDTEKILMPKSRKMFREACDLHGIPHD